MDKGEETQDSREQEGNQPDLGHGKSTEAEVYALESPVSHFRDVTKISSFVNSLF